MRTKPKNHYDLTILMPCLNEELTVGICIKKAREFLDINKINGEILISDNGSSDNSQKIAKSLGARVIVTKEKGYGSCLISGINEARGDIIIMGDSDNSYNFFEIDELFSKLKNGYEMVIGNRFAGGIEPKAMPSLHKYLGNPVLSLLGRVFFNVPIKDFHCGLRGFSKKSVLELNLSSKGMEFASEMIVKAAIKKLKIVEVPIKLYRDGRVNNSHLNTWSDGWRHLKFLLTLSPYWLYLLPGLCLFIIGSITSLILINKNIELFSVVFSLNTFTFGCFFMILGIQLICYGIISFNYLLYKNLINHKKSFLENISKIDTNKLIIIALIFIILGIAVFFKELIYWISLDLGEITDQLFPRKVLFGLSLLVIGIQTFFSSFILDLFKIENKH